MKRLLFVAFTLTLLLALTWRCERENPEPVLSQSTAVVERLVFGSYHGFCSGEDCADYYLLERGLLYVDRDVTKRKPFPVTGKWEALPKEQYALAAPLLSSLPKEIWRSEQDIYGAPDAYDQGGYYLEVQLSDGTHRSWSLDTEYEALPDFLQRYTQLIAEILSDLKSYGIS
jgi:hypothetical protein